MAALTTRCTNPKILLASPGASTHVPVRGALARRRSVGAGTVPPPGSQSGDRGWPTLAPPGGPLKQTVRDEQFGSSIFHASSSRAAHRATLDHSPGSQRKLRAHRCWLFDRSLLPVRSICSAKRLHFIEKMFQMAPAQG
jgi:hypothetical protein